MYFEKFRSSARRQPNLCIMRSSLRYSSWLHRPSTLQVGADVPLQPQQYALRLLYLVGPRAQVVVACRLPTGQLHEIRGETHANVQRQPRPREAARSRK
eukprot:COSAG04_NODE_20_length_39202_cov_9.993530_12_plen_99_part_00